MIKRERKYDVQRQLPAVTIALVRKIPGVYIPSIKHPGVEQYFKCKPNKIPPTIMNLIIDLMKSPLNVKET